MSLSPLGSTYTIWGKKNCPPNNGTKAIYSGKYIIVYPITSLCSKSVLIICDKQHCDRPFVSIQE